MPLHGHNFIACEPSRGGRDTFRSINPATEQELEPAFQEATADEVDAAARAADEAFDAFRRFPPQRRAALLDAIAAEIEAIGEPLIERAATETALAPERLRGERARTANQLRMFARMVEEGSWVNARIDRASPDRKPAPKPDLRRMSIPVGPIVAFAASNFPLAISVAGNDTAAGLAAGCPVIVKAHPAHPGTSELVAAAVARAVKSADTPPGVFSLLHGRSHTLGLTLVRHPLVKAVGFTGSLRAGRALFDAANARAEPIPVYAEMGSINPVFVLPGALAERGPQIAEGLKASVTLGVGQFCTNPGLVVALAGDATARFEDHFARAIATAAPGTMLYPGVRDAFQSIAMHRETTAGVRVAARGAGEPSGTQVGAVLFATDAQTFLADRALSDELFGPSSLLVTGDSRAELEAIARDLDGHLTATVHGTPDDLRDYRDLISILELKVGRLVFNGYPTGIEPCPAVHHGGPYPATTDPKWTSIGTAAADRFVRPICYQDFPQAALPDELRDENPRNIWRLIDGAMTKDAV